MNGLAPFDIKFMPQKAVKGQAIADFLAAHPWPDNEELHDDLPDDEVMLAEIKTWQLYFDGTARSRGVRVGIVFVTPFGGLIPYSCALLEICSNNVAEYEPFIIGLELAHEMRIDQLEVFGDSQLIIRQINGQYEVRDAKLAPLYKRERSLMNPSSRSQSCTNV